MNTMYKSVVQNGRPTHCTRIRKFKLHTRSRRPGIGGSRTMWSNRRVQLPVDEQESDSGSFCDDPDFKVPKKLAFTSPTTPNEPTPSS
eukprot:530488-Rhodomonas_salina.1